jgi:hypothetical protein
MATAKSDFTSPLLFAFVAGLNILQAQEKASVKATNDGPAAIKNPADLKFKHESFTFVRIQYSGVRGRASWNVDYPDADRNFSDRFHKVTELKTEPEGKVLALTNSELKNHPFIYMAEGASMNLSDADSWGEAEWESFRAEMKRVFPEREAVELPIEHPLFHCFYVIREKAAGAQLQTWDGKPVQRCHLGARRRKHYRGLFDDRRRLMAVFCHNTDLGDGWEREDVSEYYFREFSLKKAYPMGINIVVFALTQ